MKAKFFITKEDNSGLCRIQLRVSVNGKVCDCTTGRKVYKMQWCPNQKQLKNINIKTTKKSGTYYDSKFLYDEGMCRTINLELGNMREKVFMLERRSIEDGKTYTAGLLVSKLKELLNPKSKKDNIYNVYVEYLKIKDDMTVSDGTKRSYHCVMAKLKKYQEIKNTNVNLCDISFDFMSDFNQWLNENGISSRTSAKYVNDLKNMVNRICRKIKLVIDPGYKEYRALKVDTKIEIVSLTNCEYKLIRNVALSPALERVRDVFIFMCFTSLRHSDAKGLRPEHVKNGILYKRSQKTKYAMKIPLVEDALLIFNKYKNDYNGLPKVGTSHFNKQLRKICHIAGIDGEIEKIRHFGPNQSKSIMQKRKHKITSHTGRKTFITNAMKVQIPLPDLMAITGHLSSEMIALYDDIDEERRSNTVEAVFETINK